jgi:V/A-type H+-transporting ATPase subunit A
VVQATLRVVKVFWSLEDKLAYQRHFPAISWLNSYSLYHDNLGEFFASEVHEEFAELRQKAIRLLQQEAELSEIVKLVGVDALSPTDRLILETSRSLREDFLHQNAFHEVDTYCSLKKCYLLLRMIMMLHEKSEELLHHGVPFREIQGMKVRERIARARYVGEQSLEQMEEILREIEKEVKKYLSEGE